ncbi:hypothetical protein KMZ32_13720 [Phycicoccus sp. MAQZ13P-2]|uniref:hypothetical protein n=1 Tax=Phycicoccus mangrovi TaxID=2840470 RepID=UPI001BFFEF72|nr:hypothetical protein [Phycicoccus mangrovi]MBT9256483.1 hypothetical protein [Phycicoccus mangrovi]MBT9275132.1 hypothetical protein [Phycicoccus mangrovi]
MDVVEVEALARRVEEAVEVVGVRAGALARASGEWWEGPAADALRAAVEERRTRLAALVDELAWLARSLRALASALRASADDGLGRAS